MRTAWILLAGGLVLGCRGDFDASEGGGDGETTNPSTSTDDGEESGDEGANEPPVIQSLTATPLPLGEGQELTVSALVQDEDSAGSLLGTVQSPDGTIMYVTFEPTGESSYEAKIGWDQLVSKTGVSFEGTGSLSIVAVLTDSDGAEASDELELGLECGAGPASPALCQGTTCTDLDADDAHCSGCDLACETQEGKNTFTAGGCTDGACEPLWGECIGQSAGFADCDEYCADLGATCSESCGAEDMGKATFSSIQLCEVLDGVVTNDTACDAPFNYPVNPIYRCCCVES